MSASHAPYPSLNQAWYALRKSFVEWRWEEQLEEVLRFSESAKIDEVIVVVNAEEFNVPHLDIDSFSRSRRMLQTIRDELSSDGIVFSLNPWTTTGHLDRGRTLPGHLRGVQTMTDIDGLSTDTCCCPLDAGWRSYISKLWEWFAELDPRVVWIEDDIRSFNHTPIDNSCFCPLHIGAFSRKTGISCDLASLSEKLLRHGSPDPLRRQWLAFQNDVMQETIKVLVDSVHRVNPKIMIGLMSSGPESHVLEGRDWPELATILRGSAGNFVSRPPLYIYEEKSLSELYSGPTSIRRTRAAFQSQGIELSEVENVPFSIYAKSQAMTFCQIASSILSGCDGVTLNLFDHLGSPISDTPEYGKMLGDSRGWLDAIRQAIPGKAPFSGIGLLHHDQSAATAFLDDGNGYSGLRDRGDGWVRPLEALGFSTTWDIVNCDTVALSGQTVRSFSAVQIQSLLEKSVILDLEAVQCLADMGWGSEVTGVSVSKTGPIHSFGPLAAEHLHHPAFGGGKGVFLTATLPDLVNDGQLGLFTLASDAITISSLVDNELRGICPLFTLYQNSLGGRVATLAYNINTVGHAGGFLHPYRKAQMQKVLEWLSDGPIPLRVDAPSRVLPLRQDGPSCTLASALNVSLDTWNGVTLHLATGGRLVKTVESLNESGQWAEVPPALLDYKPDCLEIHSTESFQLAKPVVFRIVWGGGDILL